MKKLLTLLIALALLVPLCTFAQAQDEAWRITDKTLYVSDFETGARSPWLDRSDDIEKLVVEEGVTKVPSEAFAYLDKLTEVTLPESLTEIGGEAFAYCKALRSFTVSKSIELIGEGVFRGCTSLETIVVDEENRSFTVTDGALCADKTLIAYPPAKDGNEVAIPSDIERIGAYAFYACRNIEKVTLPDGIASIGRAAFEECKNLKDISLPEGLSELGEKAFYESGICPPYATRALVLDGWYISYNGIASSKITLDDEITHIASGAFTGSSAGSITLSSSLMAIGDHAFSGCPSLGEINLPEDNTAFVIEDGILYEDGKACLLFCLDENREELTLPEEIVRVRSGAFRDGIEKITVTNDACVLDPDSLKCKYLYGNEGSGAEKYAETDGSVIFRIIGRYYNDFIDVNDSAWYADDIEFAVTHALMSGVSKYQFAPEETTSRAMLVRVLYNYEKHPDVSETSHPFTDVPEEEWYSDAVKWAYANKIVSGTGDTTFSPDDPITREQFATILFRYAEYKALPVDSRADLNVFTDTSEISDYALDALAWANAGKMITGTSPTRLEPKGDATRAQMAAILRRFITANVAE